MLLLAAEPVTLRHFFKLPKSGHTRCTLVNGNEMRHVVKVKNFYK